MKNPFKPSGFDTHIGPGFSISGDVFVPPNSINVIDGEVTGRTLCVDKSTEGVDSSKTIVMIGGKVRMADTIEVPNITVTGWLSVDKMIVAGTLALEKNGRIEAKEISYGSLHIQPNATIIGNLKKIGDKDGDSN